MAVLTTSQLTFYDFKDAYNVEINPDCIVINCDEKGISKEITEVNISYSVYCGRSRVSGTAVLDFAINGETIEATVQDCSSDADGYIRFSIPASVDFTHIESAHIIFSELSNGDGDTFTFNKYVQFIKAVDGASGSGMVFKIYSEDGIIFREDMGQINLETLVFVGESRVELPDEDYTWEYDNGSGQWVLLGHGSTLSVSRADKCAFKTIRCIIKYNDCLYEDYISLTDEVNIYSAEIKFFHGSDLRYNLSTDVYDASNIFKTTDKYIVAYMALYKNGIEIDPLQTNRIAEASLVNSSTGVITTNVTGTFKINDLLYFVLPNKTYSNRYDIIIGQYDGNKWNRINAAQDYTYIHSNIAAKTISDYIELTKIMVISKSEINKTLAINFSAYKQLDNSLITFVDGSVVDLNDPIVSSVEPSNAIDGQLWVDTSTSPYIVKICSIDINGNISWNNAQQEFKGNVYTSRPTSYEINDVWILNDGEECSYMLNGVAYHYGPGSMLRSSANRTSFNASDWSEIVSEITIMRDNVAQYFEFNSETGLKIGQKDQKFYVNISATEMGFYDNSNPYNPNKKVVSIGNQSATIVNATIQQSATFDSSCDVNFNTQINMNNPSSINSGFIWKIETDGSLSLICNI